MRKTAAEDQATYYNSTVENFGENEWAKASGVRGKYAAQRVLDELHQGKRSDRNGMRHP